MTYMYLVRFFSKATKQLLHEEKILYAVNAKHACRTAFQYVEGKYKWDGLRRCGNLIQMQAYSWQQQENN